MGPQIQANDSVNDKPQSLVLARIRHCTKYKEHIHDLNSHRQPNKHVCCLFYFTKNKKQPKCWGDYRLTTQLISDRFISFISKPMLLGGVPGMVGDATAVPSPVLKF